MRYIIMHPCFLYILSQWDCPYFDRFLSEFAFKCDIIDILF